MVLGIVKFFGSFVLFNLTLSLAVRCRRISTAAAGKESVCHNVNPIKIVRLNANYYPRETKIKAKPRTIKTGEVMKFTAGF